VIAATDRLALIALALVLAIVIAADAALYGHGWRVLGFPVAIVAVAELLIGLALWRGRGGVARNAPPGAGVSATGDVAVDRGAAWLALGVAGVFLLGPRLALPLFAFAFARCHGARTSRSAALALVCLVFVELLQRFVLAVPLADFPLFGG
jgi:hypothetical protein